LHFGGTGYSFPVLPYNKTLTRARAELPGLPLLSPPGSHIHRLPIAICSVVLIASFDCLIVSRPLRYPAWMMEWMACIYV
jgi:hypothetical protein